MKHLILVGYMGSGKSSVGKLLSKILNIPFVDLDERIQQKEKSSIHTIFETKGELYFRKLEYQIFHEIVSSKTNLVISTGGGTPCYYNNHEILLKKNIVSIYLSATVDTLMERLKLEKSIRPLLSDKNDIELKEFIAKHLFERSYFYHQAQYKIQVDGKNPEAIVSEIEKLLT